MSTPERGRRRTDLFDERLARLRELIRLNAPRIIIADECRLVVRAHHGNSPVRVIGHDTRELVVHLWHWYALIPVCTFLCRHDIYHYGENDPDCPGCWVCGKGEPPLDLSFDAEEVADVSARN